MLGACVVIRFCSKSFSSLLSLCLNQYCLVVDQGRRAPAEKLLSSLPYFFLFLTLECEYREGKKVRAKRGSYKLQASMSKASEYFGC